MHKTITELRAFLELANNSRGYVKNFATFAAPLTEKLKVGREDGKNGSKKPVEWEEEDKEAFVA